MPPLVAKCLQRGEVGAVIRRYEVVTDSLLFGIFPAVEQMNGIETGTRPGCTLSS